MNKAVRLLPVIAFLVVPFCVNAECLKHMPLATQKTPTTVELFDKPGKGGKVLGKVPVGTNVLFLDKKEGNFHVQITDPQTKAQITGWAEKKYFGKAVWLDSKTQAICTAPEGGHKGDGSKKKHQAQAQG